jgi:transcriptional regulator with XRE-family HTH domain
MVKMARDPVETVRERLRRAAEKSGMTQEEIGLRMGMPKPHARKAISRLLNLERRHDPRLSTILAFCEAVHVPLKSLLP